MIPVQKRFIAGATCPECQLVDKIVVYQQEGTEFCECVRCGYQQQQSRTPKPVKPAPKEREQVIRIVKRK